MGANGVVNLDYMGAAEFEFGAIPKALRRMMYHYESYDFFKTGILNTQADELIVFCNKENAEEIIEAIREFIKNSWPLKEWTELEKIKNQNTRFNFWWCIDTRQPSDWMAFFAPKKEMFAKAIEYDYKNWWMKKTPEEREQEYKSSFRW